MAGNLSPTERAAVARIRTNLRVLKPSRKKVRRGDIFRMQLPDETYLFGRVIGTPEDTNAPFIGPIYFIYIYAYRSTTGKLAESSGLNPDSLLIAPLFTNRLAWSDGVFETIESASIADHAELDQHCFWAPDTDRYYDEFGNELAERSDPWAILGVTSYRTIDDRISKALGIPLIPEDQ